MAHLQDDIMQPCRYIHTNIKDMHCPSTTHNTHTHNIIQENYMAETKHEERKKTNQNQQKEKQEVKFIFQEDIPAVNCVLIVFKEDYDSVRRDFCIISSSEVYTQNQLHQLKCVQMKPILKFVHSNEAYSNVQADKLLSCKFSTQNGIDQGDV